METEFNLLDEKWILVRKSDCTTDELSLTDALLRSHEYTALSGELPTQDVSILRLLLAVLHTVFSRYTPEGEYKPVSSANEAMERWKALWDGGKFPEKPIREYLLSQHEKFWLFHPERPFYQTKAAETRNGTSFTASKLHGALSQSNNKVRLFPVRVPDEKSETTDSITLTYSEAARWLLYLNDYADTAGKKSEEARKSDVKLPSISVGWLGQLGIIYAIGDSLFRTLMLNFVVVNPLNMSLWGDEKKILKEKPIWELDKPREKERCEIASPDNLAELYTLQSRRIFLERKDTGVTGYYLLGGDFFDDTISCIEQMTLWERKDSKLSAPIFYPKKHNYNIKIWCEFSTIFALLGKIQEEKDQEEKKREKKSLPGIVWWVNTLRNGKLIDKKRFINFGIASVEYDSKKSAIDDLFSDSLTFHTDLLTEVGKRWQKSISEEVCKCEDIARKLGKLAADIEIAAGSSPEDAPKSATVSHVQEQYYYEIDVPFREWLLSIDPEWESGSHEEHECIRKWHEISRKIAESLGKELVNSAEASAVVGRFIEVKDKTTTKNKNNENGGKRRVYLSAAGAFSKFMYSINFIYPKEEQNG